MVLGPAGVPWLADYSCIEEDAVAQEATKQSGPEIASRILRQRNGPRKNRSQAQRETLQRQGKWWGFAVEDEVDDRQTPEGRDLLACSGCRLGQRIRSHDG